MKAHGWGDGWSAQCLPGKQEDLGSDPQGTAVTFVIPGWGKWGQEDPHSSPASHTISSMKDPMPISIGMAKGLEQQLPHYEHLLFLQRSWV